MYTDIFLYIYKFCCLLFNRVSALQDALEKNYKISVENQILLISGGETLSPGERVGSYSAGMVSVIFSIFFLISKKLPIVSYATSVICGNNFSSR